MSKLKAGAIAGALCLAAAAAQAEDVVITQYKADPSGAPYGIAIEKGFFMRAGLQNAMRAMKYVGSLEKDVDLGKMIDTSFLPSDLQAVKK